MPTAANFMLMGTVHHMHTCRECAEICEECARSCESVAAWMTVCRLAAGTLNPAARWRPKKTNPGGPY